MDVDVDHHINAASRTVGARTLEAGEAQVVAISRTYDEPIEDVWEALTNVERIPRWFLPITGELRVGGPPGARRLAGRAPEFGAPIIQYERTSRTVGGSSLPLDRGAAGAPARRTLRSR